MADEDDVVAPLQAAEAATQLTTEVILRPNGKRYRPREITTAIWDNEEAYGIFDDYGVFVFGTHDIEFAQVVADDAIGREWGRDMSGFEPYTVWKRLTYYQGELTWVDDPVKGRAGVHFRADYTNDPRPDAAQPPTSEASPQ